MSERGQPEESKLQTLNFENLSKFKNLVNNSGYARKKIQSECGDMNRRPNYGLNSTTAGKQHQKLGDFSVNSDASNTRKNKYIQRRQAQLTDVGNHSTQVGNTKQRPQLAAKSPPSHNLLMPGVKTKGGLTMDDSTF